MKKQINYEIGASGLSGIIQVLFPIPELTWSSCGRHNLLNRRLLMDKYIGFDIDSKKVSVCVVEAGKKEHYATIGPDAGSMKKFLLSQKEDGVRLNLAYEVSGYSGYLMTSFVNVWTG